MQIIAPCNVCNWAIAQLARLRMLTTRSMLHGSNPIVATLLSDFCKRPPHRPEHIAKHVHEGNPSIFLTLQHRA